MVRAAIVLALIISSTGCRRNAGACRLAAADLERFLHTMDLERGPVPLQEVSPPLRDDLEDRTGTDQAAVYVTSARIVLSAPRQLGRRSCIGEESCEVSELDACFGRLRRCIESSSREDVFAARRSAAGRGPDARKLYVVIDRAARWERVVPVAAAAHRAGFTAASFLFARTPATPPPPRTWVDEELDRRGPDRLDGDNADADAILRIANAVLTCDSFKEPFHRFHEMSPSEYMIQRTPQQVVECNCDLDMAALRSLMWRLLGTAHPVTLLDTALTPSAAPLQLPAATPWGDASAALSARTTATWFVIAPAPR